ncbi:MAG: acyl carrier protein [Desulfovibrionaceae bacterium]
MGIDVLTNLISEVFDIPDLDVTPATSAQHVPGWDSFTHINLVLALEIEFGVTFSTEEIVSMLNVGAIVELLKQKNVDIDW